MVPFRLRIKVMLLRFRPACALKNTEVEASLGTVA